MAIEIKQIEASLKNLFRVLDRNGSKTARKIFEKYDKDKSGELSKDELKKWNDKRQDPEDKISFEKFGETVSRQELEDHMGEMSKKTLDLVVERFESGDLEKGFVKRTVMEAAHRLYRDLDLAVDLSGQNDFKKKLSKLYDETNPKTKKLIQCLNKEKLTNKTKEVLFSAIMNFFGCVNYSVNTTVDKYFSKYGN